MKTLAYTLFALLLMSQIACKEEDPNIQNGTDDPACILTRIYDAQQSVDMSFELDENEKISKATGSASISIFGISKPISDSFDVVYENDRLKSLHGKSRTVEFMYDGQEYPKGAELYFENSLTEKVEFKFMANQLTEVLWLNDDDSPKEKLLISYNVDSIASWTRQVYNVGTQQFEDRTVLLFTEYDNKKNFADRNLIAKMFFLDPVSFGKTNLTSGSSNGVVSEGVLTYNDKDYPTLIVVQQESTGAEFNRVSLEYSCK